MIDLQAPGRFVPLQGAFNVRDLGGYPTAEGRSIRWGLVYRGDGPERVDETDRAEIVRRGIATVIDLRAASERRASWSVVDGGVVHDLSLFENLPDVSELPPLRGPEEMAARYVWRVETTAPIMVTALEIMAAASERPMLFHCSGGKDRTGTLSAVLLELLGVGDDVIVADYALSHEPHQQIMAMVLGDPKPQDVNYAHLPEVAVSARAETMESFLAQIRAKHGSIAAPLWAAGLSEATVATLRGALLV
jgi:protein-tyrosine phosphatase